MLVYNSKSLVRYAMVAVKYSFLCASTFGYNKAKYVEVYKSGKRGRGDDNNN